MSVFDFSGQWISYRHDDVPDVIMDIDRVSRGCQGRIYVFFPDSRVPSLVGIVELNTGRKEFAVDVLLVPFSNGRVMSEFELSRSFPDFKVPISVRLEVKREDRNSLSLKYKSDKGDLGEFSLSRTIMPKTSNLDGERTVRSWSDFKRKIEEKKFASFVYRGQSRDYPLQSTFHRTARKDLVRYLDNDLQVLHRSLVGRLGHLFNLDSPQELGAFLNLAQHHGFPTPLLDWTYSPFVAAWFAFKDIDNRRAKFNVHRSEQDCVRIYCIDKERFMSFRQFYNLTYSPPHTSFLEALPIENDRAIPQQALLMSTNLQDVEGHLFRLSDFGKVEILTAFDIPAYERDLVLSDLAKMGITKSTMVPDLESICVDLKNRLFH